jgi:hypothetical protein
MSRPQTLWQLTVAALFGGLGAYVPSLLFGHSQARALTFAGVFGGTSWLLRAFMLRRWNAAGRPPAPPPSAPNLPPYGGEWPPAH